MGPPLRPSEIDAARVLDVYRREVEKLPGPHYGVLLGVTPEMANIVWDPPLFLAAVESSQPMIDKVWPGNTDSRKAILGNWFSLPFAEGIADIVVGDGSFSAIAYEDYRKLARSVSRVLKPGGVFSIRIFKRPEKPEPLSDVWDDLRSGKIENFHIFKWRLAMALQGDNMERGAVLGEVWDAFADEYPCLETLSEQTGWPVETLETIDNYRWSTNAFTFPTIQEVLTACTDEGLTYVEAWRASYTFSERCPHLVFRK